MVQKFHPQGVIWVGPGMGACQKKKLQLSCPVYKDVHAVAKVLKCLCQNIHIALQGAKISCAKTSMVPKIPCVKMSSCRKWRWNVHVQLCPQGQNVPVMKCLCRNVSFQNVRCRNGGKLFIRAAMLTWQYFVNIHKIVQACCHGGIGKEKSHHWWSCL